MPIIFRKKVVHPGLRGRPFLGPALDRGRQTLISQLGKAVAGPPDGLEARLDRALRSTAFFVLKTAQELVPFRTGNLRASLNVKKVSQGQYSVGTAVSYAPIVEFGTRKKNFVILPKRKKALRFKVK